MRTRKADESPSDIAGARIPRLSSERCLNVILVSIQALTKKKIRDVIPSARGKVYRRKYGNEESRNAWGKNRYRYAPVIGALC